MEARITGGEMSEDMAAAADAEAQATASAETRSNAAALQRIVPGPDGIVQLPPGTSLDDIKVVGRDLVVSLPDGSAMVIVDGAVNVPQLVIGGVEIPPMNLAALLVGQEPEPAAGPPRSSGGNFEVAVDDIGDPFGLGDLLAPTELSFGQPVFEEIFMVPPQDGPRVDVVGAAAPIVVDETVLGDDATANLASLFDIAFSGDSAGTITYALSAVEGPSGLVDMGTGEAVILSVNAQGVVEGRTETGGLLVFTVSVDGAGNVTLDQLRPVVHSPDSGPDQGATLASADLVQLTATATEEDGDTASASVGIGRALVFEDDAPAIEAAAVDGDAIVLQTSDSAPGESVSADFSGAFSTANVAGGADGVASVGTVFSLQLNVAAGSDSGLTSGGEPIFLSSGPGGSIVGSTADGETVFTLAVSADGVVTLTQFGPVDHGLPGDTSAPFDGQLAGLPTGLVSLVGTATVVDGDGDAASDTATIDLGGNIGFADDGPAIAADGAAPVLSVDETLLSGDSSADFASLFTASFGADEAGSVAYALGIGAGATGLVDTASGETVVLSLVEGQVVGTAGEGGPVVFTISVDAASGRVTLDQVRPVVHADATNPDDAAGLAAGDLITLTAVATDSDGDSATAVANIGGAFSFRDDGPVAEDDAAGLFEGGASSVTFDVDANDNAGADGTGSVTFTTLTGVYGTLTINPDGTQTYTLSPAGQAAIDALANGDTLTDTFGYTLTDGDGDGSAASLVVTLTGTRDPEIITDLTPKARGGDVTVDEPGLAAGPVTGTGTFSIESGDGVASLTVGGQSVIVDGVFTPVTFTTPLGNTLSVTGYDPATGELTYSYTLGGAEEHPAGAGANSLFEDLSVVLTDSDGDIASATLSVNIVDDVAAAADDAAGLTEGGAVSVTVDVAANDLAGADGVGGVGGVAFTTLTGVYGTLTINPDGTQTYTLSTAGQAALEALDEGETLTDTFEYTLTDGDGDGDTANLVVTLTGIDEPVVITDLTPSATGGEVIVDEAGLAAGPVTGSGTFTVEAGDGVASLTVGGQAVIVAGVFTPVTFTTPLGNTLSISGYDPATGELSYSYTLNGAETHAAGAGANSLFEDLGVVLTDTDGDTANATLSVNIVDGVAAASDDAAGLTEGGAASVTVDVIANDAPGADGATVSFATLTGTWGTLTINPDGTQTYTLSAAGQSAVDALGDGETLTETFGYTLTDADGDADTANLVVTLTGSDDPVVITDLTPSVSGGDVTVDEGNLAGGAVSGTGTFSIAAADGVASLTVGGQAVIAGGVFTPVTFTTPLGNTLSITGYDPATGELSYSYELLGAETHAAGSGENSLFEDFAVVLTDTDGDSTTGTLSAQVIDDLPVAADDSASLVEGGATSVTVDVEANDAPGADGGSATFMSLTGALGTLTINPDGTQTYTLSATGQAAVDALPDGATLTDTFLYLLTDGDGDSDMAELVVTITGTDDPVIITNLTPSASGGDILVDEDDLAGGPVTGSGTFTIDAADGVASLTVGGQSVIVAGMFTPVTFTTPLGNTLSITGYDPVTGELSYTYELNGAETHAPGAGENSLFEDFAVVLTDTDGDSTTATLSANIVDDIPAAADDAAGLTEGAAASVTVDVIANDAAGADGATVSFATLTGTYGTLTLNPDGTQTYTLSPAGQAAVDALPDGATLTDTFGYTLTDGDSDTDTANLVVTLTGSDDPVIITDLSPSATGGDVTVDEDDLAGGPVTGSGTFSIEAADGVASLTVGGQAVIVSGVFTPVTFTTPLGNTLVITGYDPATGELSYSYTLNAAEDHPAGAGENSLFEDFAIVLTDTDGDTIGGTLSANIVDDIGAAADDAAGLVEGGATSVTVDVIANDAPGADGAGVAFATLTGTWGTLTLNPDGTQTYTLTPAGQAAVDALPDGATLTDTFAYTLADGDGDADTANLVVTLTGTDDPVVINDLTPSASGGDVIVDEDDLAGGPVAGTGTFTVEAADGIASLTVGGQAVITAGTFTPVTFTTPLGNTLSITAYNPATGELSYSYTLNAAKNHPAGAGENSLFEDFAVVLTDTDGDSTTGTLSANIVDDVPVAADDAAGLTEGGPVSVTLDVDANDAPGADGAAVSFTTLTGTWGTLRLNPDGTQTYTLSPAGQAAIDALVPGATLTDTFGYTLTDGDGDADTANLVVTLTGTDDPVIITGLTPAASGGDVTVDEDDLAGGPVTGSGTFAIEAADGVASLTVGGQAVITGGVFTPVTFTTPLGNILSITGYDPATGALSYSYTLNGAESHVPGAGENSLFEDFAVVLTDADGDTIGGTLSANIVDDVPAAADDAAGLTEGGPVSVTVDVDANDAPGADGAAVSFTTLTGTWGTLTLNPDGTQTYTLSPAGQAALDALGDGDTLTDTFDYTLTDGDGDTDTAQLLVTLTGVDDPVEITDLTPKALGGDVTVDEDDLTGGSDATTPESTTQGGTFTIQADDGIATLTVGGQSVIAGGVFTPVTFTTPLGNTLSITGYNPATGQVTYTYTLNGAEMHDPGAGENSLFEDFAVVLTDTDGTTATSTLSANIVDDVPATGSEGNWFITEDSSGSIFSNALFGDVPGADGAMMTSVTIGGVSTAIAAAGTTTVVGPFGTYTFTASGDWTFDPDSGHANAAGADASFSYVLTDSDGDTATGIQPITVRDGAGPMAGAPISLVVDDQNLADGSSPATPVTNSGSIVFTAGSDAIATIAFGADLSGLDGGLTWFRISETQIVGTDGGFPIVTLDLVRVGNTAQVTVTLGDNYDSHPGINLDDLQALGSVGVIATDIDGDTATGSVSVSVSDDVATAADDAAGLTEGGPISVTVDVDANDTPGADGASVSFTTLTGIYGTLTLNPDGTQTYTLSPAGQAAIDALAPGAPLTDTFGYTLTDGDGDTDTANLVVTLTGSDDPVIITDLTPKASGGDVTVDEDDLAGGPVIGSGTFTIQAGDGVASLTVGGQAVISGGTFTPVSFTTPLGNTLSITAYNPATGELSYSYTLNAAENHPAGASENSLFEDFPVVLTDTDGDATGGILSANIVDDVPTANADPAQTVAEDAVGIIGGNILVNDLEGADGASLTSVTIGGTITAIAPVGTTVVPTANGTYTFTASGDWTFDPTPGVANAAGVDASFSYTITDGDGDSSSAQQPITVTDGAGPIAGAPISLVVDDENLTDGSSPAAPVTDTGNVVFTVGSDAIASIAFGTDLSGLDGGLTWVRVSDTLIVGSDGGVPIVTLDLVRVGNSAQVTATLNDNYDSHPGLNLDDLQALGSVGVVATDVDGDTATGSVSVSVSDDVATAADDAAGLTEGGAISVTVDVDANDTPGADGASVSFTTLVGAYGTLTLNPDGTQTYTLSSAGQAAIDALAPGVTLTDTFGYTLTDGDGDTDTANLVVTLTGSDDPVIITGLTPKASGGDVTVDEDDLAGGPVAGSGTFTIEAGDGVASLTVGGQAVITAGTFTPVSFTTPLGNTLSITAYNPATGELSYSYTLNAAENHPAGASENSLFEDFPVVLTDTDGDATGGVLSANIVDDIPVAANDTASPAEDMPIVINVLANDAPGADGVDPATGVAVGTGPAKGTVVYNGDGTFTYTPNAGETGSDSFTYTITDRDGDSSTATVTLTLAADSKPTAGVSAASVDDDGVTGGNPASNAGDLADPNSDGDGNEATFGGSLSLGFGGDGPGSVDFAAMDGATGTVGQETVIYSWNAVSHTLTATGPRGPLFTIEVTNPATGAYKVTLVDNVLHAVVAGENDALAALTYTVTDADGSTATGTLNVTFDDDSPSDYATAPGTSTGPNVAGTTDTEALHLPAVGADGPGTLDFSVADGTPALDTAGGALTFDGLPLYYTRNAADPSILEARTSATPGDGTLVFEIDLNEGAGTYTYTQFEQLASVASLNITNLTSVGGGNVDAKAINIAGTTADFILTTQPGNTVNTNSSQIGVGMGQDMGAGENIRIDFVENVAVTGSSPSSVLSFGDYYSANSYRQDVGGLSGAQRADFIVRAVNVSEAPGSADADPADGDNVFYGDTNDSFVAVTQLNIYNAAGTLISPAGYAALGITVTAAAGGGWRIDNLPNGYDFEITSNTAFEAVQIEAVTGTGTFKLGAIGVSANVIQGVSFEVPVKLTDADGDTVGNDIRIDLSAPSTPPVVLDLDGDGAEFLGRSAGVGFDYNGDGHDEATAWVAADDALLVHDANGDGVASNGSEIVFATRDGQTDLEGLKEQYDSNGDGVLSAADAGFASFGVWQDANGNGRTDAGEFQTLSEAGIESIGLVSDGAGYSAAGGDVRVHGEARFTWTNGGEGRVADASFATGGDYQRQAAQGSQGLSNALVAASLVATIGAAGGGQPRAGFAVADEGEQNAAATAFVAPRPLGEPAASALAEEGADALGGTEPHALAPVGSAHTGGTETHHDAGQALTEAEEAPRTAELLADTDAPEAAPAHGLSGLVDMSAMPAILVAPQGGALPAAGGVGEVLADALQNGGAGGPDIDALLANATSAGGVEPAAGGEVPVQAAEAPAFQWLPEGHHLAMEAIAVAFDHAQAAAQA